MDYMPTVDVSAFFRVLADETRLAVLHLLSLTDLRGGEIVAALGLPGNAVSYHLKLLRDLGLLRDRRSHADGRDIYYSLDVDRLHTLYLRAGRTLYPTLVADEPAGAVKAAGLAASPLRVLFVCTHNSARSQLAEAILRLVGGGAVESFSAGGQPTAVHPMAVALLQEHAIDPDRYTAKSLDRFADARFDYVITVCDRMREDCPTLPGAARRIHWSLGDPASIANDTDRAAAFHALWDELHTRIGHFLRLARAVPLGV
jgi:protein-tyrosine-phosphatase/DNA-binding transcriptional ArsR family regulator